MRKLPRLSPSALAERIARLDVVGRIRKGRLAGSVFLVGGALRELALGRSPNDYDLALARPEDIARIEEIFGAPAFLLGKKPIQTHRIAAPGATLDITILAGGIEDDLRRRDFTINAVAYAIGDGKLLDPLGGLEDIKNGVIRYPRKECLSEDPLRMVKAVRHLCALSGFSLDPALKESIKAEKGLISQSAAERIKYELDLIMLSANPFRGMRTMEETGLLFEIFPELLRLAEIDAAKRLRPSTLGHTLGGFRHVQKVKKFHHFTDRETRLAGYGLLFHDLGKPATFSFDEEKARVHFYYHERHSSDIAARIMERLRFSASEARAVRNLIENHMRIFLISTGEATEKAVRRIVYRMEDFIPALVLLTLLDLYGNSGGRENESTAQVRKRCREVLSGYAEWKSTPLPRIVTGDDLLAAGFSEGPALGRVLREIREKQISGEITEKAQAMEYAASRQVGDFKAH
jgi:poly(A) polymerase